MINLVKEWLEYAENDFMAADILLTSGQEQVMALVGFHAQQTIEKIMKAILLNHKQRPPKTHDLARLYELILPFCPDLDLSIQALVDLTGVVWRHAIPAILKPTNKRKNFLNCALKCDRVYCLA